ncbi:hypothetical protein IW147_006070 [Coemansia sp. RSA 720]|nr:hypothetical protein IW147_006070 [Coemansia sp. RSA 720]
MTSLMVSSKWRGACCGIAGRTGPVPAGDTAKVGEYAYLINMAVVVVFCKAFELMRAEGVAYVASLAEGANMLLHVLGNGSNEIINVIQAIVLSFTIIPLLKLQDHAEVMGPEFAFGCVACISAAALTLAIVTLNAYMVASIIPLDSPSMYVALCAVVIVYVLVLSYTAAFLLRCVWSRRMVVNYGTSVNSFTPIADLVRYTVAAVLRIDEFHGRKLRIATYTLSVLDWVAAVEAVTGKKFLVRHQKQLPPLRDLKKTNGMSVTWWRAKCEMINILDQGGGLVNWSPHMLDNSFLPEVTPTPINEIIQKAYSLAHK